MSASIRSALLFVAASMRMIFAFGASAWAMFDVEGFFEFPAAGRILRRLRSGRVDNLEVVRGDRRQAILRGVDGKVAGGVRVVERVDDGDDAAAAVATVVSVSGLQPATSGGDAVDAGQRGGVFEFAVGLEL
ncbi:MAG: hypothetical protein WDN04_12120 [Rhodospirillales bacterium]